MYLFLNHPYAETKDVDVLPFQQNTTTGAYEP